MEKESLEALIKQILAHLEGPILVNREGLIDTPRRVVKSWNEIYGGYSQDPKDIMTVFSADGYDEI